MHLLHNISLSEVIITFYLNTMLSDVSRDLGGAMYLSPPVTGITWAELGIEARPFRRLLWLEGVLFMPVAMATISELKCGKK